MGNAPALRIEAFGRVRAYRDDRELTSHDWTYAKARELLVYLASHPPRTKAQIGLALWPNASESQLRNNFRVTLFYLRRALGSPDWVLFDDEQYAFNRALNYTFDVEQFEGRIREALHLKAAVPQRAATLLQEAAQLYQGDFCADLEDSDWHSAQQVELQNKLVDALLALAQSQFSERRFAEAADTYRKAIARDGYREAAHRGLMRCLVKLGESGQSLQHYRTLAATLRSELRQKPESETTALFERIQSGIEIQTASPAAPFQAPARVARFVGREAEIETLKRSLGRDAATPESAAPTTRTFGLVGMGGIGKTTLAIELAHRARALFPDGVLWAHVATSEPMAILDSWARAFQCDYSALSDLESRAAAMRSLLADKQTLLILDDCWSTERARPLLLGGPHSSTLLTSRSLEAITALDAVPLEVPTLDAPEGELLLARIIGAARVLAEPASASAIGELLGLLPLALEIVGKRLAMNPRARLDEMATRLHDQVKRLDELKLGDKAVRASFEISWEMLPDALRRVFAHLAVFEGRAFTSSALAAVAQAERRAANDGLDALVALSLLSTQGSVHYRQHPLLADFALEKLAAPHESRARMSLYYLAFSQEHRSDYFALADEWDNLLAGLTEASHQQLFQAVIDYGYALTEACFAGGLYNEARQFYPTMRDAARELEDQDAFLYALLNWARASIEQSEHDDARLRLDLALQTARELGDERAISEATFLLGWSMLKRSQYTEARSTLSAALTLKREVGDRVGEAAVLFRLGSIEHSLTRFAEAVPMLQEALQIQRDIADHRGAAQTMRLLAMIANVQGDLTTAEVRAREALALCESLRWQDGLAMVHYTLAGILRRQERLDLAYDSVSESIAILQRTGDRQFLAQSQFELSRIELLRNRTREAMRAADQAIALARDLDDKWVEVMALRQAGDVLHASGDAQSALRRWQMGLELAVTLQQFPYSDSLKERIASAERPTN